MLQKTGRKFMIQSYQIRLILSLSKKKENNSMIFRQKMQINEYS